MTGREEPRGRLGERRWTADGLDDGVGATTAGQALTRSPQKLAAVVMRPLPAELTAVNG